MKMHRFEFALLYKSTDQVKKFAQRYSFIGAGFSKLMLVKMSAWELNFEKKPKQQTKV